MAKNYTAGGPIEAIRRRLQGKTAPIQSDELLEYLEKLDSYYRERLDGYAVKVTQLEDKLRQKGL
jgi:hypothetical protein|tara:strand:+ start:374 stop:568 length:195 start_codon:yes stop_codon:yes gene_type:complete